MNHLVKWATVVVLAAHMVGVSAQGLSDPAPGLDRSPARRPPVQPKPTLDRPPIERPTIERPTIERPTIERPTIERPTIERPTIERPTIQSTPGLDRGPAQRPPGQSVPDLTRSPGRSPAKQSAPGLDRSAVRRSPEQKALESRERFFERAMATRMNDVAAAVLERRDNVEFPGSATAPQSGTGRLPEAVRQRRDEILSRLQDMRPRPGKTFGLESSEKDVHVNDRRRDRHPEVDRDPPIDTIPNPDRTPDIDVNIRNRRRDIELDIILTQRLALIDMMRDRVIDTGDPGRLDEIDRMEDVAREQHDRRIGDDGSGDSGRNRPKPPLPPGGRAGRGWFKGLSGVFSKRQSVRKN
jgi:hypothetical protein